MTHTEFADTITNLPVEQQNAFFETLKDQLSEKDWLTAVKFISLYGMFHNPEKYAAMKNAVLETLKEVIYNGI
jgi:hypothetical protein